MKQYDNQNNDQKKKNNKKKIVKRDLCFFIPPKRSVLRFGRNWQLVWQFNVWLF